MRLNALSGRTYCVGALTCDRLQPPANVQSQRLGRARDRLDFRIAPSLVEISTAPGEEAAFSATTTGRSLNEYGQFAHVGNARGANTPRGKLGEAISSGDVAFV